MGNSLRILVIDDDKNVRESLSLSLENEGFTVDTASNGKDAISKSFENFYNLAIIDWRLPDMEGTKLLGELKETTPKMMKIMLTGFPSMENAIDAVNNCADAFLVKPVQFEQLLAKIKALIKKQQDEKEYNEEKLTSFLETRVKLLTKRSSKS